MMLWPLKLQILLIPFTTYCIARLVGHAEGLFSVRQMAYFKRYCLATNYCKVPIITSSKQNVHISVMATYFESLLKLVPITLKQFSLFLSHLIHLIRGDCLQSYVHFNFT